MNCLSLDTHVMAKDGLKRITEIKVGDLVYAFNQKNNDLVLKKCSGVFDNGIKKVYELKTLHHSIKATLNHPFLTVKRGGKSKQNSFAWKTIGELRKGDEVIVQKKLRYEQSFIFKQTKISKLGDYKVNRINNLKIPTKSSPELMELLGMYVGDGWTRIHKAEVGFALPKNTKASKRMIDLHKKLFKKTLVQKEKNYLYIRSVNFARFIDSLGFGKSARNKLIPSWVFTLPQDEKEAFLRGLMLSDGYIIGKSLRYVSASIELLKTLRLLLQTMDYRVGKIHQQTKKKGTFVVYRQLLEDSTYGYICFSRQRKSNIKNYLSQIKQRDFLVDNEYFSTEKISSIEFVKEEPTLDLRVEDEHNFIADGIVVHNTGIQRSSSTPKGAATTTAPAGKVHQGKEEWKKDIAKIAVAHHIPYVAQASVHNPIDLSMKAKKAFETHGPAFLVVLQPCTLGWRFSSDMTMDIAKLAVESRFWPLYEVENGRYRLNYRPAKKIPLTDYLKPQGRFKHLFKPENAHLLEEMQKHVDERWDEILKLCEE
ncbi:MAG: LAGLIDADG family homing endonuclease [Candidatus Woesearchaeota archaeon]